MEKANTTAQERSSFFLDMECDGAGSLIRKASRVKTFGKFRFLHSWYITTRNLTATVRVFERAKTRMDMDVKIFHVHGDVVDGIYEIFNPGINVGVQIRWIGNYTRDEIRVNSSLSYYESRKNMSGVCIRAANVIRYPFKTTFDEYMVDWKLRFHDIYSKYHYQLFLILRDIHGFSYNTSLPTSWFGNTSSGEGGGMGKMFLEDTVDISSAGCIMRLVKPDRVDFYDFIMPFYKFKSCFYFKNPGMVKPNFREVLKPFSKTVWFSILITACVVCVCIECSYVIEERRRRRGRSSWCRSVFMVVAAFCQQGLDSVPSHLTGRIVLLHLLIMSVLLYNYYTSSLVSSLISTEPEVLKTIRDLYESKLQVGIELQAYTITHILNRSATDYYLRLLNNTKIFSNNQPHYLSVEEGIHRVRQGGYAYHTESINAYPLISKTFDQSAICDLAEITLIKSASSLATQKKSQFKKLFQISLRKAWVSGILKKLLLTWIAKRPECLSSSRVITVGINDLFLPYFILGFGMTSALVILGLEIAYKTFKERYQFRLDNPRIHFIN
ncbi:ionotropic receptor 75a-like [Rhynchophorus ferrugineus]|uniref:ionotropic receptor 75a-like n=1 Tax=Rhynchophorus ferrugineus TaxID=354439 RepID=UPI003FCC799B